MAESKIQKRHWQESVQLFTRSTPVATQKNCFAVQFTNLGDTIARVNGMIIFPSASPASAVGDSRAITAHKDDLYVGSITISFDNPAGVAPLVEIVQLCYSESYE